MNINFLFFLSTINSLHLGIEHGRLFKVIYKDKKYDSSVDIAKELFPEDYLKRGDNGSMTSETMSSISFKSVASPAGPMQFSEQEVLDAIRGKKCNKCDEILNMNNGTLLRHFLKHFR